MWNLDTGERVQRITGFGTNFGQVALSTDGTRVFATDPTPAPGTMGRLRVWDVATGREVLTIPVGYDPNPYRYVPRGLRYEAGKLCLEHDLWVRVLDGTPLPEPKK
ncbi:MAG: hypothetical protein K2V38_09075 [Gemmataceae bacterium]|nr:hypothetical protein [Gemmataceae bacterium]